MPIAVLKTLPNKSVACCVTSPPYYGLRNYETDGQIGLEKTPDEYVHRLVEVFREIRRVLRNNGTFWLNIGDSYAGYHGNKNHEIPTSSTNGWANGTNEYKRGDKRPQDIGCKPKDLIGVPWLLAFALRADGWYLRSDIIWSKSNCTPESVVDRPTKAHEYLFLLPKSQKYLYDADAIKEPASGKPGTVKKNQRREMNSTPLYQSNRGGRTQEPMKVGAMGISEDGYRNKRSVWTISTKPFKGAHLRPCRPRW
jgi:DNA modification methylase